MINKNERIIPFIDEELLLVVGIILAVGMLYVTHNMTIGEVFPFRSYVVLLLTGLIGFVYMVIREAIAETLNEEDKE